MQTKIDVDSREVRDTLDALQSTKPEIKKSFRSATRQSLNIIRKSVRQGAATVTSNREKRTKGVSVSLYKNTLGGSVGINKSFSLKNGKWFGLYLLELGTSDVIGRNGKRHGATPAKPFFASSVRSSQAQASDQLNDNIIAAIEKAANKRK